MIWIRGAAIVGFGLLYGLILSLIARAWPSFPFLLCGLLGGYIAGKHGIEEWVTKGTPLQWR